MFYFRFKKLTIAIEERCLTDQHFIDQDSECPPVHSHVMALTRDHFRCQVLGRATVGHGELLTFYYLGEAVVNDLEVASLIDQDIF